MAGSGGSEGIDRAKEAEPPADTRVSDDDLIRRARDQDHEAFSTLVRRYSPLAYRTAVLVGGANDADDAVQDAFLRAYGALDRFELGAPFRPWLLTIVVNCTHSRSRSAWRQLRLADRSRSLDVARWVVDSAESDALAGDTRRRLLAAVDELPDKQRLVVTCRYLLELSEAETAHALGIPVGTVKSRLNRGLERLRTTVEAEAAS